MPQLLGWLGRSRTKRLLSCHHESCIELGLRPTWASAGCSCPVYTWVAVVASISISRPCNPRTRLSAGRLCLQGSHRPLVQAERKTTDWQREVLKLPVLSWVTLDQAKDPVARHAQLWAAWADMQAAFVSWTSKPLLDSTSKVCRSPGLAQLLDVV